MESRDRDFARLADWVEGHLSEEEARSVEEQVAADSTMQADVAWLRAFNLVSENTVLTSPPSELRGALVKGFQKYAERKRQSGSLKRILAELSFDSARQLALGLRATSTPESQREFVYSSEVADIAISVRLRAHDGLWDCVPIPELSVCGCWMVHQKSPLPPLTIWASFRSRPCHPARMMCLRAATIWRSGLQGSKCARGDEVRSHP